MDEGPARLFIARETVRPFDLENKPLARADLITLAPDRHWMLVSLHHAICDGWSMPTLLRDLAALYAAETGSPTAPLPELDRHYEDFASWQHGYLSSADGKDLLARWKERLLPLPEPLALPTDRRRPKARRFAGDFHEIAFGEQTERLINDAADRHGTTAFSILTALVQILMYRQCGQTDIPLGMLVAGREQTALDDVVGFFVNTVVLRQNVDPNAGFDDHLAQTGKTIIDALSDQAAPFEDVVAAVNAPRDPARNPLFDVLVAWQDSIPNLGKLGDAELSLLKTEFPFSKFDLAFYFSKQNDALLCQIEFDTDLFDKSTIQSIFNRLEILAAASLSTSSSAKIAELPILPADERARIDQFNATDLDLAIERSISEPFIDQVRATPGAPAVIGTSATLSYEQFARRASGIAAKLRAALVGPGDVIGVAVRRSIDMLAAIHGILLCGAAYSPLDPDHPEQRRTNMLDDLGYPRVITTADLADLFDADKVLIIDGSEDADIPDAINAPDDLAYVMFTSGSTGRPKGVEIAHRGVLNRILWMQDAFPPAFPPVDTLVPHAAPMLLIDRVLNADAESLTAEVRITKNSLFFTPANGVPAYVGIEYIAQTVAAYSGWRAQSDAPGTAPKIGYLLGTRKMTMACDGFADGDVLVIHVQNIFEDGEMGVFDGEVRKGDETLVSARINVYQPDDTASVSSSETPTSNQETTKP